MGAILAAVSVVALAAPQLARRPAEPPAAARQGRSSQNDPAGDFADIQALAEHREVETVPEQKGLDLHLHEDESGRVRDDLYRASIARFRTLRTDSGSGGGPPPVGPYGGNALQWNQIGPGPATVDPSLSGNGQMPGPNAGAAVDIAIDPRGTTDRTIFSVFNSGGVWRSTNGGTSWTPMTDQLDTLSFGAVVQDPNAPDTVYAGTGNIFNNGFF